MSKKAFVPDAWDDDWESQADKADAVADVAKVEEEVKVTKAERLAKHADNNKKIWESAETPETPFFLAARETVPLKQEFKPALKVLSRKPAPKLVQRVDPVTGIAQTTVEDDEDETEQKAQPTPEELRLRAQKAQQEKQRKYDEARQRILGTPSRGSTPVNHSPSNDEGRASKGRGRGRPDVRRPESRSGTKELFDPNYTPKTVTIQKKASDVARSGRNTPREDDQVIRAPRGPDSSGRGGFGFANRGGRTS